MSAAAKGKGAAKSPDIAAMTFEEALENLEKVVEKMDDDSVGLDAAVKAYERGVELRDHCQRQLDAAQERINKIEPGPGGAPGTAPYDPD